MGVVVATHRGQSQEPVPAGAGRPQQQPIVRDCDQRRSAGGVQHSAARGGQAGDGLTPAGRPGARVDDGEFVAVLAQQLRPAVAIEIRDVEELGAGGFRREARQGGVEPGLAHPIHSVVAPARQRTRRRRRVDFAVAVGVTVEHRGGGQVSLFEVVEAGERRVLPAEIVAPQVVGRLLVQHADVEVFVAVEVGHQHLLSATAPYSRLARQVAERAVAVVVVEGVAFGADGEHVQVAVVIGIEQRGGGARRIAKVAERAPAPGRLPPMASALRAAQHHVHQAIGIHVAPQHGAGRSGRLQWMIGVAAQLAAGAGEHHDAVRARGDELRLPIALHVHHRERPTAAGDVGVDHPGRIEQRACRQRRRRRGAGRDRQRFGFWPHLLVGDLGRAGGGAGPTPLPVRKHPRRFFGASQASQCEGGGVVGADQVGVQLDGFLEPARRCLLVAGLQQRLAEEVGGVGIPRVGGDHLPKQRDRAVHIAAVEAQNAACVQRPQVLRMLRQHVAQNVERQRLVPVALAVQSGDGEIHPRVQPIRRGARDVGEHLFGRRVLVPPHKRHAAVVGGDQLWRDAVVAAASAEQGDGQHPRPPPLRPPLPQRTPYPPQDLTHLRQLNARPAGRAVCRGTWRKLDASVKDKTIQRWLGGDSRGNVSQI